MWAVLGITALLIAATGCERATPAPVHEVHDWLDKVHCRLQNGEVACKGLNVWGIVRAPAADVVIDTWHRIPIHERVTGIDLSVSGLFACAVTKSGRAYCWGDAYEGALGNGELPSDDYRESSSARPTPQQVIGLRDVEDLGIGVRHACALTRAGAVLCWGSGAYGALGDGNDNAPSATPVSVVSEGATSIAITDLQTCALMSTGRVLCWGDHLPDSAGVPRPVPTPTEVANLDEVTAVTGDRVEMCAVRRGGKRQCWRTAPDRFKKP